MGTGFRTDPSGGVAAPPYTNGPYKFSEVITFEDDVTVEGDFTVEGNMIFGDAAVDTLTIGGTATVSDDNKFYFRDSGLYVYSSADGQLDVIADTKLQLTSPTIDLEATDIALDGDVAIEGSHTFATGTGNVSLNGDVTIAQGKSLSMSGDTSISASFSSSDVSNVEPMVINQTLTGAGATGGRSKFLLNANAALGSWSNALKAEVVYNSSGKTSGLGSAICAEMELSTATNDGTYALIEGELNLDTGALTGTNTSFIYLNVFGADSGTFDTNGYLLNLQGLNAGSGKIFNTGTTPGTDAASLRINVGGTDYFIALKDAQNT